MSAIELLTVIAEAVLILLSITTAIAFIRHRDDLRRDVALTFVALAVPFYVQALVLLFPDLSTEVLTALGLISVYALAAQPYLLLRLVRYFQPVPRWFMGAALVALLLSFAVFYISLSSPAPALVPLFDGYLAIVGGYVLVSFVRKALHSTGVVRWRRRFSALGASLLILLLWLSMLQQLIPALAVLQGAFSSVVAIVAAFSFHLGFAPPRWLRRAWQINEFRAFLMQSTFRHQSDETNAISTYQALCSAAVRSVNGIVAVVVQQDEEGNAWKLKCSSDEKFLDSLSVNGVALFANALNQKLPRSRRRSPFRSERGSF
jgi:hypothetical protein